MKIHDFAATISNNAAFDPLFEEIESSLVAKMLSTRTAEDRELVYQRLMAARDIKMMIVNYGNSGVLDT